MKLNMHKTQLPYDLLSVTEGRRFMLTDYAYQIVDYLRLLSFCLFEQFTPDLLYVRINVTSSPVDTCVDCGIFSFTCLYNVQLPDAVVTNQCSK